MAQLIFARILLFSGIFVFFESAPTSSPCCVRKTVGGVPYTLVDRTDTSNYNCISDCVYERDDAPGGGRFCFQEGNFEVVCNGDPGETTTPEAVVGETTPSVTTTDSPFLPENLEDETKTTVGAPRENHGKGQGGGESGDQVSPNTDITFSEEEILSVNGSTKGLNRIKNADNYGKLPQQVYYNLRGQYLCTGTMITNSISMTAGHCVDGKSPGDLTVHLPEEKCDSRGGGIPVCKIETKHTNTGGCGSDAHDIALLRLSRPMPWMGDLSRDFYSPRPGDWTVMAGTGINNHNTCKSLISYQTVTNCGCGSNFYCTKGTFQWVSGACGGDSGGPSWTFGHGFTGVTKGTFGKMVDACTTSGETVFPRLSFYRTWIEDNIRGSLARC